MWTAHDMGVLWGEVTASNFSNLNKYKEKAGVQEKNVIFFNDSKTGSEFYNLNEELISSSEYGLKRFSSEVEFNRYIAESNIAMAHANKLYELFLQKNIKETESKKLFNLFLKHMDGFTYAYTYFHACQPQYFYKIEEKIKNWIDDNVSEEDRLDFFGFLTTPSEKDVLKKEEEEWLEILLYAKKLGIKESQTLEDLEEHTELIEMIRKHADKYISLGTAEVFTPWNVEYYIKILNEKKHTDIEKIIKNKREKQDNSRKHKDELIKKYSLPDEIIWLGKVAGDIGSKRIDLRFAWSMMSHTAQLILNELAERKLHEHININTIYNIKISELQDYIENDILHINIDEINKRKDKFIYVVTDCVADLITGVDSMKKRSELVEDYNIDVKQFSGSIACRGKIIGKVIKFNWTDSLVEKMEHMEFGDILVAGQTRPQLMPAIKKAGAIVTDEGGITSHAAIVSRELGVPCIIGTKIATKVLTDGDMVEIDAIKGIIKIINKWKN